MRGNPILKTIHGGTENLGSTPWLGPLVLEVFGWWAWLGNSGYVQQTEVRHLRHLTRGWQRGDTTTSKRERETRGASDKLAVDLDKVAVDSLLPLYLCKRRMAHERTQ
eukprot:jgi/Botrbrau1/19992/Bobra.200_1s0002.1